MKGLEHSAWDKRNVYVLSLTLRRYTADGSHKHKTKKDSETYWTGHHWDQSRVCYCWTTDVTQSFCSVSECRSCPSRWLMLNRASQPPRGSSPDSSCSPFAWRRKSDRPADTYKYNTTILRLTLTLSTQRSCYTLHSHKRQCSSSIYCIDSTLESALEACMEMWSAMGMGMGISMWLMIGIGMRMEMKWQHSTKKRSNIAVEECFYMAADFPDSQRSAANWMFTEPLKASTSVIQQL